MGQVGVIQHKKIEKGSVFKKLDNEPPAPAAKAVKRPGKYTGNAQPSAGKFTGTSRPTGTQQRGGAGNTSIRDPRIQNNNSNRGGASRGKITNGKKPVVDEAPKKFSKAAAATTGYTGTSRPRPAAVKRNGESRGGALLQRPNPYGGASRGRSRRDYDDEEEMDDFIDYDDEGDEGGPRYDYASDESSDMEAGMDDIDDEERRAEMIARREDIEEQKREQSLKMAKEERKRKALEEVRMGAGRRR